MVKQAVLENQTVAHRKLLRSISYACVLLGLVILVTPLMPRIEYALQQLLPTKNVLQTLPPYRLPTVARSTVTDAVSGDRLVIPEIHVDIPIVEGLDESALDKGAWHMPNTSQDIASGNFVLSAHRFRYRPPVSTTFYLLDKLKENDTMTVTWHGTTQMYRVTRSRIVEPTDLTVLAQTTEPTLTLITCTPLFSTAQRLIVTAVPVDGEKR